MSKNPVVVCAVIGSSLIALLLTGAVRHAASAPATVPPVPDVGVFALNSQGKQLYAAARYEEARSFFVLAYERADSVNDARASAMNRNNAGFCETATMQYSAAFRHLTEARAIAEQAGELVPLIYTMNSLANLYVLTGQYDNALNVARTGLHGPAGNAHKAMRARLLAQICIALTNLHRLDDAAPWHQDAIRQLNAEKQFADIVRLQAGWADANIREGRLAEAGNALEEAMRLVEKHKLNARASLLTGMANLESARHNAGEAARLFDAALTVRNDRTPRWKILSDRGQFRLQTRDDAGALNDFREASAIAAQLRLEMVPADQDRVAFESGIGAYLRGFVDAGNRVAVKTGDTALLAETFNAADQARLWSLRTLLPASRDWRTHLSPAYWEKFGKYQQLQRKALASATVEPDAEIIVLKLELQRLEAAAGREAGTAQAAPVSALAHAQSLLDSNTVLFSFHISPASAWIWAVDKSHVSVYPLPALAQLELSAKAFASGTDQAAGRTLYQQLFGGIPAALTGRSRWLLELDAPLHNIPFGAMIVNGHESPPVFLVERAALQTIPGSALLEKRPFRKGGSFVGVSDPVYNAADPRFRGAGIKPDFALPRLAGTAREVEACAREWASQETNLLTGMRAGLEYLRSALADTPAILHFATHVVPGSGDYRSGLIALSLNGRGAMDLLGPQEILARPVPADLVVMNGCHSSQGETLPVSGRMGLTRAWIGAGAGSVLATQWDIGDDDSQELMTSFYRTLRKHPEKGVASALRESQAAALRADRGNITRWAGYYLLSRTL